MVFNDICRVMTDILDADVLVISKKGKVLGMSTDTSIPKISELITDEVGGFIDGALNDRLLGILSTKENVNLETVVAYKKDGVKHHFLDDYDTKK